MALSHTVPATAAQPVATRSAAATPPHRCLPAGAARPGRVEAVVDAVSVALAVGTVVRLADIGIPVDPADRAALESRLTRLVSADVVLYPAVAEPDRHGRLHGHLVGSDDNAWLQADLVARGLVFIAPDGMSDQCARPLLAVEAAARADRKGIWRKDFRVFAARDRRLGDRSGQFAIVEGNVVSVGGSQRNVYLNFGNDWSDDFTVIVPRQASRDWPDAERDLDRLTGERVRVRGYLESWNGPLIRVEHPAQIEMPSVAD